MIKDKWEVTTESGFICGGFTIERKIEIVCTKCNWGGEFYMLKDGVRCPRCGRIHGIIKID